MPKKGEVMNLVRHTVGRLTVIEQAEDKILPSGRRITMWKCKCECGKIKNIDAQSLRKGSTKSCGCLHNELSAIRLKKIAEKHGKSETRLYNMWSSMKARCYNTNRKSYNRYGGRGITICDEWFNDFQTFYDWSIANGYDGKAPKGQCTLDRIDNNKGYSPENCRWVDVKIQANNTSRNHLIEYKGKKQSLTQWATELGISRKVLEDRINKMNWDIERAFTQPKKEQTKRLKDYLITYKGEQHTLSEWSKILGIKYFTLVNRIHNLNWSVEESLSTPTMSMQDNIDKRKRALKNKQAEKPVHEN